MIRGIKYNKNKDAIMMDIAMENKNYRIAMYKEDRKVEGKVISREKGLNIVVTDLKGKAVELSDEEIKVLNEKALVKAMGLGIKHQVMLTLDMYHVGSLDNDNLLQNGVSYGRNKDGYLTITKVCDKGIELYDIPAGMFVGMTNDSLTTFVLEHKLK